MTELLPITKEWRLHPDWDYFHDDNFDTSEEKTKHFLGELSFFEDTPSLFKWPPCKKIYLNKSGIYSRSISEITPRVVFWDQSQSLDYNTCFGTYPMD